MYYCNDASQVCQNGHVSALFIVLNWFKIHKFSCNLITSDRNFTSFKRNSVQIRATLAEDIYFKNWLLNSGLVIYHERTNILLIDICRCSTRKIRRIKIGIEAVKHLQLTRCQNRELLETTKVEYLLMTQLQTLKTCNESLNHWLIKPWIRIWVSLSCYTLFDGVVSLNLLWP